MSCLAWAFSSLSPFLASVRRVAFQDGLEVFARQGKRDGERDREREGFSDTVQLEFIWFHALGVWRKV